MNIFRYVLYITFFLLSFLLWNQWEKEHMVPQIPIETAMPALPESLKHNPLELQDLASPQLTPSEPYPLITVTTDVMKVLLNPEEGEIVQIELLKYPNSLQDSKPFVLLDRNPANYYVTQNGLLGPLGYDQKHPLIYRTEKNHYTMTSATQPLTVNLIANMREGIQVIKTYTFEPNSYVIQSDLKAINSTSQDSSIAYYMQISRQSKLASQKSLVNVASYIGAALSSPENPYQKISFSHLEKNSLEETITGGWLAMLQHYFLSAWIPNPTETYYYYSRVTADGVHTVGMIGEKMLLKSGETTRYHSTFYAGPKISETLKHLAPNLDRTVDYSSVAFFSLLATGIFKMMKFSYDVFGNWGLSIILITLLIRILFYPLSLKSFRSMAAMRTLQPKIQQLKEKYGDNRQMMSQAMMELYRKEKINPMSGCLPILLQIPVFLALYWVLIESVELRQAPFWGWIQDLSTKDPYYILPVLMGISMFLQQKLGPQPNDPNQAKIMLFLPVVLTVVFLNFPAGLMLYWVVNNTLSILQQWHITRTYTPAVHVISHKHKQR